MTSVLRRTRRLYGDRPAILDSEGTLSWEMFIDRCARAGQVLKEMGLNPGDRFAILSPNSSRQAELIYGAYWTGVIPVPINYRLAAPEMRYILDHAQCKLIAVADRFADRLDDNLFEPWRAGALYVSSQEANVPQAQYESMLGAAQPATPRDCREDDDAILLYTGGTTGRSKGVRLSHKNIVSNGLQVAIAMQIGSEDRYLHVSPMFHSADLLGTGFTIMGAAHAYLPEFSEPLLLQALQDHRITVVMLTPTMIILALQEPSFDNYDLTALRLLFYGSSPMAVEWIRRAMDKFAGAELQQSYGLTETAPILTNLGGAEHIQALETGDFEILRSAGRALPGVDLRIAIDGTEAAAGEIGEVVVRGPNVSPGYLDAPEQNAEAFQDGWFHTGDLGRLDEHGYLYLMDRKKDMIITGGENVYSAEVEAAIYKHPDVHEVAVIGVPDQKWGEALFAVIVPAPGVTLSEEDIIRHCRNHIGGYKIPRQMAFTTQLPKSAMGKILKTELRRIYSNMSAT